MSHEPLAGLKPSGPSRELKQQVLAAARAAAASGDKRTVWDVVWESRVVRTGWATASLALLVVHLLLPAPVGSTVPERAGAAAVPPELEQELKLPEVAAEAPAFASVENEAKDPTEREKGQTS